MPARNQKPVVAESINANKTPATVVNVEGSFFSKSPSWRFSRADLDHYKWSILDSHEDVVQDPNDPNEALILHQFSKSIDCNLLDSLKARESTTWGDLLTQNGGRKRGTNSHNIPMNDLIKEARQRATEIGLVEDGLLSLRLDGTHRVFGVMDAGVLNIIWFDRKHEICPSNK